MEDTLWAGLTDSYIKTPMGVTAENLAEKYGITRLDADEFALASQQRWGKGTLLNLHKASEVDDTCNRSFMIVVNVLWYLFTKLSSALSSCV